MYLIKIIKHLPIVITLSFMIGCTTIDPKPFEKFNASLVELDKGVTSSLDVTIPMVESRFRKELVDEILRGKDNLLGKILVKDNTTDPFYISSPPVFMLAQRFKLGISKTNMAWLKYSNLLVKLSSEELVDKDEFVKLSTDLNNNALDAIQTFKDDPSDNLAEDAALFSEVAIGLALEYIKTKTKEKLTESITVNQKNIERYVVHMQEAIITIAQKSTIEYKLKAEELSSGLVSLVIKNVGGKKDAKIQKTLSSLVESKRAHSAQMISLQALHAAYEKIPEAHKELAKRLKDSDASIASISALLEKGVQMHASFEAKAKLNKAELVQAKADAASSEAALVELKYQQAELKASQALFDSVLANNALSADPDNDPKKKDAENKKAVAEELKLEADKLKESAVALRAAATAIQESANDVKSSITAN